MIDINLNKALDIHKEQIRKKRVELFPKLDIDFMKALEQGNMELAATIGSKKQTLRDATNFDSGSITNLSDVKALWDVELLGETPYQ